MSREKQLNEERTAAASYILTFYQHVSQLTDYYATYKNIMIELRAKYKNEEEEELKEFNEEERRAITTTIQNVRYIAHKTQIQYKCIMQSIGVNPETDKTINEIYAKINIGFIPKTTHIENYVIELNKILIGKIVKGLLETSQNIISKTFDNYGVTNPPTE